MMMCGRACFMRLVAFALTIVEVRTCAVTAMVQPAAMVPALPAAGTVLTTAAAGVVSGELTKSVVRFGGNLYWAFRTSEGSSNCPDMQPFFKLMSTLPIIVGADADGVTWDCWKPILHETSAAPSRGRLLTDILSDPVISDINVGNESIFVRNRWNESWRIDPVMLPWGQIAAHATLSNSSADLVH
eukprot:TRINITY_DN1644_c0_g1_i2.p1 TRINITY_DN1644_c0_g1~~TRINITY_DN1644_c0_g1_i2.p1  ORF type:complete len:186 (+),score=28.18 TRINITY_DN1644_c0_g1_i2:74-631(+)